MIHNFIRKEEISTPENLELLNNECAIGSTFLIVINGKHLCAYPADRLSIVDELVDLRLLPDIRPLISRGHRVYPQKVVVVLIRLQIALKLQKELVLNIVNDYSMFIEEHLFRYSIYREVNVI
jgi:hypothetical protein